MQCRIDESVEVVGRGGERMPKERSRGRGSVQGYGRRATSTQGVSLRLHWLSFTEDVRKFSQ
jgi:hypothetical protein